MQCNGTRLFQAIRNDGGDKISVEVRHANRVGAGVRPIEMGIDPVDGQAVSGDNVVIDDDFLLVTFVNGGPKSSSLL